MKKIIFHTQSYAYLAEKLLASGCFETGQVKTATFPDGERYQQILTPVEDRHVILIGGTINDEATLELYDLASTLVTLGAAKLSIVIPYFGYSTMERAVKTGEVVTAKTRAKLLSSIPRSTKGNKVYLLDLHSEGIPHYFEEPMRSLHLYCKEIVMDIARSYGGSDFVLGSTDAGRAKWVESLGKDLGVDVAFLLKRRLSGSQTEVTSINADVTGKIVVIYDDMIRSGGSIISASKVYKAAGAKQIFVITTHGIFINDAISKMKNSGLIEKVICTDTHFNTQKITDDFVEVRSVAPLLEEILS